MNFLSSLTSYVSNPIGAFGRTVTGFMKATSQALNLQSRSVYNMAAGQSSQAPRLSPLKLDIPKTFGNYDNLTMNKDQRIKFSANRPAPLIFADPEKARNAKLDDELRNLFDNLTMKGDQKRFDFSTPATRDVQYTNIPTTPEVEYVVTPSEISEEPAPLPIVSFHPRFIDESFAPGTQRDMTLLHQRAVQLPEKVVAQFQLSPENMERISDIVAREMARAGRETLAGIAKKHKAELDEKKKLNGAAGQFMGGKKVKLSSLAHKGKITTGANEGTDKIAYAYYSPVAEVNINRMRVRDVTGKEAEKFAKSMDLTSIVFHQSEDLTKSVETSEYLKKLKKQVSRKVSGYLDNQSSHRNHIHQVRNAVLAHIEKTFFSENSEVFNSQIRRLSSDYDTLKVEYSHVKELLESLEGSSEKGKIRSQINKFVEKAKKVKVLFANLSGENRIALKEFRGNRPFKESDLNDMIKLEKAISKKKEENE